MGPKSTGQDLGRGFGEVILAEATGLPRLRVIGEFI